jgi:quinol monooxygenase YgiN
MKQITMIFAFGIVLFFSSCNNSAGEKAAKTSDTAAAVASTDTSAKTTVAEPAFTPFKVLLVQHKVKNFDKWKAGYMAHDSMRNAYGISRYGLGRVIGDTNTILVFDKINDIAKAKEFAASPSLKDAMQKAGVIGKPKFSYADVVRNDDSKIDQAERVMVAHHVKDYDGWLKAYDGEGKATRAANGLLDRGLARGVEDPNMVYIVFAITDMTKAKARINSPELKKLMTDAGVDKTPEITYYKLGE